MSSEWRAGDEDEEEGEGGDAAGLASHPPPKRLTKAERAREDDESEYGSGSAAKPKQRVGVPRPTAADDDSGSVYERAMTFVATQESKLGVVRSPSTPRSLSVCGGLSLDLTSQPRAITGAPLHAHQLAGLNWLKSRFEMGINAILADEMGLGKTLQAISLMAYLYDLAHEQQPAASSSASAAAASSPTDVRVGPFLVVCPLTVLSNWAGELESFAPALEVLEYTGTRVERSSVQEELRQLVRAQPKSERKDPRLPFHVLLTTYETLIADADFLSRFPWRATVVDEAHRLKNASSVLAQSLANFPCTGFKLLLSGTPVQNDLGEIWGLLWTLHPTVFDDRKKFIKEFEVLAPQQQQQQQHNNAATASLTPSERAAAHDESMTRLHSLLRPFLLRRLKSALGSSLRIPPKREIILRTGMTRLQKRLYKNILLKNYDVIGGKAGGNARALVNIVQALRKCVTHPYAFPNVEPEPFVEGPHIVEVSGKFRLLRRILAVCARLRRRILLFSTSVQMLDLVQDALSFLGYTYERLDGSVRGEERYEAVASFSAQASETFVFLLSTRAGGVGLNLTAADTVIFLDADWNPQMDLQAQARAHRIGQERTVVVLRLLVSHTLEEIILKRTQRKLLMTHNILEKGRFDQIQGGGEAKGGGASSSAAAAVEDNESLGRSAQDLQHILQYGLDNLFGDASSSSAAAASSKDGEEDPSHMDEPEMTEEELEAIITGSVEQGKGEEEKEEDGAASAPTAASAAAPAAASAAAPSSRPALSRLATHALPSLDQSSLVAADDDEAPSSLYVYEGTDYKAVQAQKAAAERGNELGHLEDLDEELQSSAARGQQRLRDMMQAARAAGDLDDEGDDGADGGGGVEGDRYASTNASVGSKRKSLTQESEEDRLARQERARESASKRAEAARRRKEEAEAQRLAEIHELWEQNGYESKSVQLDLDSTDKTAAAAESKRVRAEPTAAAASAVDGASEWGAGDGGDEEEEEHANPLDAESSPHPKAMLHYVVGDATCPFVFEREDGHRGSTALPTATPPDPTIETGEVGASADDILNIPSSFDEAAESAALATSPEEADASLQHTHPFTALLLVPVDASGSWGKGGLFRALDNRSRLIGAQYELIGSMHDLHMGDVHVVDIPADQVRPPPASVTGSVFGAPPSVLHVALCVVLKRAKGQQYGPPSLQPEHLGVAFRKLASYARTHHLSVHLPRLGAQDPNIGWYGIERLLQKHVVAKGITTFVYYFQRRRPQYRSPVKNQISRTPSTGSNGGGTGSSSGGGGAAASASKALWPTPTASPAPATPMGTWSTGAAASTSATPSRAQSSFLARAASTASSSSVAPMELEEEAPVAAAAPAAAVVEADDSLLQFDDIFTGTLIYLHRGDTNGAAAAAASAGACMSDADARLVTRFLSAYDGEVADTITDRVTHIVTCEPFLTPELQKLKQRASQRVRVVQLAWVEKCVQQGRLDDWPELQVAMPKP